MLSVWQPPAFWFDGPVHELAYVIRVYGREGGFDETHPQPLWVVNGEVQQPEES